MQQVITVKTKSRFSTNQVLFYLFCFYVFFAPFEDLLEYLYGIKTVFKPYRLFGLLILIIGFFYDFRRKPFFVFKYDYLATIFMFYGIFYTLLLYGLGFNVNFGEFINSQTQMLFLFFIFLTFKRLDLTYNQLIWILRFMSIGIIINGLIIMFDYYFLAISSREKGLSDNPNYAAYGMVVAVLFLVYSIMKNRFRLFNIKNLFYIVLTVSMFFAILATGSRTGFILFVGCLFLFLVALTDIKTKIRLLPLGLVLLFGVALNSTFKDVASDVSTFNRLQGVTTDIRVPLAKAGINAIIDTKGMGLGVSQMLNRETFAKYIGPVDRNLVYAIEVREKGLSLHNMYLEIAAETGFIGLGSWGFYLLSVLIFQWKKFKEKGEYGQIHRFLLVAFICLLVFGMSGKGLLGALFWFVITICSRTYLPNTPKVVSAN